MTSHANRLALHPLSRFISRQRPNVSNALSKVEVHQGFKRNLPYLNPKVVTQASYLNRDFGVSPHLWKVTKGHTVKPLPITEKSSGCRLYCTVNQGCSQVLFLHWKLFIDSLISLKEGYFGIRLWNVLYFGGLCKILAGAGLPS